MAKKHLLVSAAALALMAALSGCHDDIAGGSTTKGSIAPAVALNTAVESADKAPARVSPSSLTANDLSLRISAVDGTYSNTWAYISDFDPKTEFAIGRYTVEAFYGSVEKQGFDCPAYYGSTEITVKENETTPVSLTATLAHAMVSITYTDAFKRYMDEWDANIHTDGEDYVYFAQTEERPAYLAPGMMTLNVRVKKPNGKEATFQVARFNAEARHHYHVDVDVNNGEVGTAVLVISFDDSLDLENVTIDLSDDIMDAPAPEITGANGMADGSLYSYIIGDQWTDPLKANIVAQGGLKAVTLTTKSKSLLSQGWPSEVDLMGADKVMQTRLEQLGFKCFGLWKQPDKMAVLDFTDVVNHLTESDDVSNAFTILVTDAMGKVSEPFSFAVNTVPLTLAISNPGEFLVGQTTLSFDLSYNGANASKSVSFQAANDRGRWTPLNVVSLEAAGANLYRVTVTVPADGKPVTIQAVTSVKTSQSMTVSRGIPAYTFTLAGEENVWARKATLAVASEAVAPATLVATGTLFLSTDGANYSAAEFTADGALIRLANLTPGTKYTARFSLDGNLASACDPVTFTTEAATTVPNGSFETLAATVSASKMNQGGKWSISAGINYQSTVTYSVSEPTGWASVNAKTTSGSNKNSWFVIPSTFNSSLSYSSTVPSIKVIGTGGGTDTPASYKGFDPQAGANAMVIRNVEWNASGSTPGTWKKEFAGTDEYYCHNEPAAGTVSAGRLFLGSYSYSDGTETFNEGQAFASRPAALKGYYRYANDAQDAAEKGTVRVQILSGSTVIANGSAELGAAGSYTEFNVPLTYIASAPKATSLRIMFSASNRADESRIKVTTYNSRYEGFRHGATLVVDNLSFVY